MFTNLTYILNLIFQEIIFGFNKETMSNKDLYFRFLNRFTNHKKKKEYKQGKKKAQVIVKNPCVHNQCRDCKQSFEANRQQWFDKNRNSFTLKTKRMTDVLNSALGSRFP